MRRFFYGAAGFVAATLAANVAAATCSSYPYTLTNGTVADATQVMADLNCAALVGAANFTGNVGIGTTSPGTALTIQGNLNASPYSLLSIVNTSTGTTSASQMGFTGTGRTFAVGVGNSTEAHFGVANKYFVMDNNASAMRMVVDTSGNVGVGTTSPTLLLTVNGSAGGTSGWQITSDERLKKNIRPLAEGLALVGKLQPVRYEWRSPSERQVGKALALPQNATQIGFIAQDVEKVLPEAVSKPKDAADVYHLNEDSLIPVLVEAIKEQQSEIQELRSKLDELNASGRSNLR